MLVDESAKGMSISGHFFGTERDDIIDDSDYVLWSTCSSPEDKSYTKNSAGSIICLFFLS